MERVPGIADDVDDPLRRQARLGKRLVIPEEKAPGDHRAGFSRGMPPLARDLALEGEVAEIEVRRQAGHEEVGSRPHVGVDLDGKLHAQLAEPAGSGPGRRSR
jgi:hypothetical protein